MRGGILQQRGVLTGGMALLQRVKNQETGHAPQSLTWVLFLAHSIQKHRDKTKMLASSGWLLKHSKEKLWFILVCQLLCRSQGLCHPNTHSSCLCLFLSLNNGFFSTPGGTHFLGFAPSHPLCYTSTQSQFGWNTVSKKALSGFTLGKLTKMPSEMCRCLPAVDRKHEKWGIEH